MLHTVAITSYEASGFLSVRVFGFTVFYCFLLFVFYIFIVLAEGGCQFTLDSSLGPLFFLTYVTRCDVKPSSNSDPPIFRNE
jgi:hypothetical protein